MQGTDSRRIFDLLPPDRLAQMSTSSRRTASRASRKYGTVNRIYQKSELITEEPDSDYVFDEDEPNYTSCLKDPETPEEILNLITFEGSDSLVRRTPQRTRSEVHWLFQNDFKLGTSSHRTDEAEG